MIQHLIQTTEEQGILYAEYPYQPENPLDLILAKNKGITVLVNEDFNPLAEKWSIFRLQSLVSEGLLRILYPPHEAKTTVLLRARFRVRHKSKVAPKEKESLEDEILPELKFTVEQIFFEAGLP